MTRDERMTLVLIALMVLIALLIALVTSHQPAPVDWQKWSNWTIGRY